MSVNSSNDSLPHPHHSSINLNLPFNTDCFFTWPGSFIFTSYNITYILLLLPLCSFILFHGFQQWWQKCSTSSAVTMSHSDIFTYHLVTIELINVSGCFLSCGMYGGHLNLLLVAIYLSSFVWYGQTFFHMLTCVERYLAVVHPITYLSLRRERGIRLRNITIGCLWLLCFVGTFLLMIDNMLVIMQPFLLILSITVVSFCSLSVLCVLIRPGPGEQGGGRERVDQSKQRAFYTIVSILGALLMRFASNLVWAALNMTGGSNACVIMTSQSWFNLPSSLVLPLLFLYRKERLVCCKANNQRG